MSVFIVYVFLWRVLVVFFLMIRLPPRSTRTDTLFPYTTLFRSIIVVGDGSSMGGSALPGGVPNVGRVARIGVRAVNIITRDGKKHLIPNELLMTQAVENWSYEIGRAHV